MLSNERQAEILEYVREYWAAQVVKPEFTTLLTGKEVGHTIANVVDDRTADLLTEKYGEDVAWEHAKARKLPRGMGDIWLRENGVYHPVNIKAGFASEASAGQPNMVSLKRLLTALVTRKIDSYWLLMVRVKPVEETFSADVFLVNLLGYLDYTHFNSGPGQLMLRASKFYEAMEQGVAPQELTRAQAATDLLQKLQVGDEQLIEEREKKRKVLEDATGKFVENPGELDQGGMDFGISLDPGVSADLD